MILLKHVMVSLDKGAHYITAEIVFTDKSKWLIVRYADGSVYFWMKDKNEYSLYNGYVNDKKHKAILRHLAFELHYVTPNEDKPLNVKIDIQEILS